jgi:hypothetical protein
MIYKCPFKFIFNFFKNNKIIFHHKNKYGFLLDKESIIDSNKIKRNWYKKAFKDYNEKQKKSKPFTVHATAAKCMGINDLMNMGITIKSHIDFGIHINDNINKREIKSHMPNVLSIMPSDLLTDYMNIPEKTSKHIIRYETPWSFSCSKDIIFLVLPIPYPDFNIFSAASGILDPIYSKDINLMLWWFSENYEEIKKGTPIAQLIPIPRNFLPSWEISENIPKERVEKIETLVNYNQRNKCPIYSKEYKKIANDLFDI